MPSPPPAEIDITTNTTIPIASSPATLVLAANSSAVYRRLAPSGVRFLWLGRDNTVTPDTGELITAVTPHEETQISTFTAIYTGDWYAVHNQMGQMVGVKVVEGESA